MAFKSFLKATKYRVESVLLVLRRTIFAPIHQIRNPINHRIKYGDHVKIGNGTRIYCYDGSMNVLQNTTICNYSKFIIGGGKLEIGKNCLLGEYGIYNTFSDLIIGNDVITADRISFVTNIHQYDDVNIPIKNQPSTSDKIVIDDGTWIGMNATILAGTHIGKNCVVAAHSVVKGEYPDFCVIGGCHRVFLNNTMKKLGNGKNHVKYKDRTGCIFCMIKIGVEIPDEKFAGVDLSNPELGNPGVGGSEYLFTLLASQLKKRGLDITIYHYSENVLPDGSCDYIVKDSIDMLKKANSDGMDILIHQVGKTTEWYQTLEKTSIKSVAWSHVYLDYDELKDVRKCNNVKRVVFVGKEEYDSYIDDDIIKKSTYIFNMVPMESAPVKRELNKKVVTYVGSLVPAKGFHKLAQIWPDILKQVPDAELYVIGNGKVYNRNAKLGKFGISQEDYENSFMKYLTDDTGAILPSVHFLGIVGKEKVDIFKNTAVGVVNPTALTETFCVSAVEMEYAYVPVVSRKKWGLLDTVDDGKTGYLFRNSSDFIEKMVCLLNNDEINKNMGEKAHEFVKENFDMNRIIPLWISLIDEIDKDVPVEFLGVQKNWSNDYKWIKGCIRFLRFNMSLAWLPSFHDLKNMLKTTLKRKN